MGARYTTSRNVHRYALLKTDRREPTPYPEIVPRPPSPPPLPRYADLFATAFCKGDEDMVRRLMLERDAEGIYVLDQEATIAAALKVMEHGLYDVLGPVKALLRLGGHMRITDQAFLIQLLLLCFDDGEMTTFPYENADAASLLFLHIMQLTGDQYVQGQLLVQPDGTTVLTSVLSDEVKMAACTDGRFVDAAAEVRSRRQVESLYYNVPDWDHTYRLAFLAPGPTGPTAKTLENLLMQELPRLASQFHSYGERVLTDILSVDGPCRVSDAFIVNIRNLRHRRVCQAIRGRVWYDELDTVLQDDAAAAE